MKRPSLLNLKFSSLKYRLLLPVLLAAALAAIVVATLSLVAGRKWAMDDVRDRFQAVKETVDTASYPLTSLVIASLAKLSGTELVVLSSSQEVLASTLAVLENSPQIQRESLPPPTSSDTPVAVLVDDHAYTAIAFHRISNRSDPESERHIVVLFAQERIHAASLRAAVLPLATGLSTIALLSTLTVIVAGRLARRLSNLQQSVERVADGDFNALVADASQDEVGRLGQAVNRMSAQLRKLWFEVNRQQSEKLLHQIAAGMAHQLRNTLTGARLALELEQRGRETGESEEIRVALSELQSAEDYVHRLLLAGAGQQQPDFPEPVVECLQSIESSQELVAQHLKVSVTWDCDRALHDAEVQDGSAFTAAIGNLVLNAIQTAQRVEVTTKLIAPNTCRVVVRDNGPGIDASLAEHVFDPFVTSKPEGMGLGLPLVKRAADKLAGTIVWRREPGTPGSIDSGWTRFEFTCHVNCQQPAQDNTLNDVQ